MLGNSLFGAYLLILLGMVRSLRIAGEKRHALGIRHRVLYYAQRRPQDRECAAGECAEEYPWR